MVVRRGYGQSFGRDSGVRFERKSDNEGDFCEERRIDFGEQHRRTATTENFFTSFL